MYALARGDQRLLAGIVHLPYLVGEDPSGIDYGAAVELELLAALQVLGVDTGDQVAALLEAGDLRVVEHRPALVDDRRGQADGKARIVELPVMVDHAAAQALRLHIGQQLDGPLPR